MDNNKESWFAEPNYRFVDSNGTNIIGTFRSTSCKRFWSSSSFDGETCYHCRQIPSLGSFRKRLSRRSENTENRDITNIRNAFLNLPDKDERIKTLQNKVAKKDSLIFFALRENLRLKSQKRDLKDKLTEFSKRGSIKSICFQLNKAAEENKFKDLTVFKGMLHSCATNFHRQKNGQRYDQSVKEFYEVIMYWAGPRLATFIAENLCGPEVHSVYRWRKQHLLNLIDGHAEENFVKIASIYKDAMKSLEVKKVKVVCFLHLQ